jgi:2-keto-3-deoxy-L-fuconate dehydrogenase
LLARQGAIVYVMDVDAISGNQVVEEIIAAVGAAYFTACNIGSEKDVLVGIDAVVKNTGKIDILVNNAGIAHVGIVESTSAEDFDRLVNINIRGVFHLVKAAVPYLKLSRGVILNMASVAALVGLPDRFAYSTTKGAVVGMTLSIAKDYLSAGIRCNCISPARVHTPFRLTGSSRKTIPAGRRKCMRGYPPPSLSEGWENLRKSPSWRFIFALTKRLLLPGAIILLTAGSRS